MKVWVFGMIDLQVVAWRKMFLNSSTLKQDMMLSQALENYPVMMNIFHNWIEQCFRLQSIPQILITLSRIIEIQLTSSDNPITTHFFSAQGAIPYLSLSSLSRL